MDNAIDGNQILGITVEGLTYLDDEGEAAFIDFATCYQKWLDDHISPAALAKFKEWNPNRTDEHWDEWIELIKADRKVGNRNFDGDAGLTHPFIEFFTEPPIRFEFPAQKGFYEVLGLLKQGGWRTFDLT